MSPSYSRLTQAMLLVFASWAGQSFATSLPQSWQAPVVPGERLSDWLVRVAGPAADTTSLHWRVEAQRAPQARLRQAVLDSLKSDSSTQLKPQEREALVAWISALPLTGRVMLALPDARWLQAAAAADPVLSDRQTVVLFERPRLVTVRTPDGKPCALQHQPGAFAADYVRACLGQAGDAVDWVWVAQPDGHTQRVGVSPWNQTQQDPPAPGAWLWAPARHHQVPEHVSDNLIRFLATQAPSEFLPQSLAEVPAAPASYSASAGKLVMDDASLTRPAALRSPLASASDWGEIGLLQTPTARMAPAGDVRFTLNRVAPYTRGTVMLQPLDWFEVGFRYTDVSNRLYGPSIAGAQTYKDKSIDLKLRLREEGPFWPQVAVGLRDLGGTGLFSGEYLVGSKRWGDWDASLGLGWGYMGARANLKNPLSGLGDAFATRPVDDVGSGGVPAAKTWFHGPVALFGGVQWHTPYDPLTVKLELDGNNYQHEPQDNNQPSKSPLNLGLTYAYSPNLDFSLALERGNRWMLGLTLHGGVNQFDSPKVLDAALPRFSANAPAVLPPAGWGNTAGNIALYTGWSVRAIDQQGAVTTVQAEADEALFLQERIERAVAVLHQDAPASVKRFVLALQVRGLPMSRIEVDRTEWVARHARAEAPALQLPAYQQLPGRALASSEPINSQTHWQAQFPSSKLEFGPSYSQSLGGPDGFLLFQLGAHAKWEQRLTDSTWLSAALDYRLLDNYGNFKYTASNDLPRVRTYAQEFVTSSRLMLPLGQITHVQELGRDHYFSAYAGLLEPMYGGLGGEWLYRPWQGRLAVGLDVNHVRQRDFKQNFSFRDYSVNTGHTSVYWDTGWNDVQAKLSVGRYLAGDKGATLDVKRVFQNGTAIGAWATKTNVSAAQFGEGSFDKGIYVTIPFDVMMPLSSPTTANIVWNPLTRDGGARLNRRFNLFDLTQQRDWRAMKWRAVKPADGVSVSDQDFVASAPTLNIFQTLGSSGNTLVHQVADLPASTWLWAGAAVLAASTLDTRVDNWAVKHQTPSWNRVGSVGNNLPLAMGLSTALLYAGLAGPDTASTAETSLKAGVYTLGASLLTRYAVGRARPYQEEGNAHFDGFNNGAFQSGFTSNHVSLAFALATPFAQKNNMPWLYGVAGLTALGRIQSRDHWLSDTVASAAMGYAIGSLVGDQHRSDQGVRYQVTPRSVQATWSFK